MSGALRINLDSRALLGRNLAPDSESLVCCRQSAGKARMSCARHRVDRITGRWIGNRQRLARPG